APEALQIVSPPKSFPRVPLLIGADVTLGTEMQHSAHAPVADTSTQPQISSDSFQLWKDWCAGQMPASDYAAKCNNLKLVPNWLPNTALGMSGSKTDGDGKEIKYGDFGANFTWSWIMVERIALTLWAETARAVGRDAKSGVSVSDSNLQQESLMRRVAFALKPPRSAPTNLKNQSLLARLLFAIKTPPPVEPKPQQPVRKRSWHEAPIADIFGGDVPETCRAWVEEAAAHEPVSEVPVERAAAFREFLIGLDARIPEVIRDKVETPRKDKNGEIVEGDPIIRNVARSTLSKDYDDGQAAIVLGSMLQRGLFGGLESAWPYITVNGVPAGMTDDMLGRMANRVGCTRHRMFGAGLSIQDAPERMSDKVLLLEVDTDGMANMMWGDSGALQLWIDPQALAAGRFDTVEATAEGC
ncbi:DUF1963 domain-containing protein, partial [Roseibium sp. RKSG952]|uniref:DUF1963 domain-containing protein n=1 Tax=Roseibium sp. RKSG952 TaxID=2529384 RepID=UPI0018AD209E